MNNVFYDKRISITLYTFDEVKVYDKNTQWGGYKVEQQVGSQYKDVKNGGVWTKVVQEYTPYVTIECGDSGLKPDIAIQFGAVPGHSVIECKVAITGLQLSHTDLRRVALMKITAGYGTDNVCELNVNVFSAWTESPNPDGITRIQGIATEGSLGMFFGPRKFQIEFPDVPITMDDLLNALLNNELGIMVPNFEEHIKKPFLDVSITASDGSKKRIGDCLFSADSRLADAGSGYEIVQWLGRELFEWGRSLGIYIYVTLLNDTVRMGVSTASSENYSGEWYEIIQGVDSVAYTGGLINIRCPWHPRIVPGTLFYLPTQFYSMENMYREIPVSTYNNPESANLYRVITMNVSFDTNSNANQMEITALQYNQADNPWDTDPLNKTFPTASDLSNTAQSNTNKEVKSEFEQMHGMITGIIIRAPESKKQQSELKSLWANLKNISLPTDVSIINMYEWVDLDDDCFNGSDWGKLFNSYNYLYGTKAKNNSVYPLLKNKNTLSGVPVLTPADKKKILQYTELPLTVKMKNELKQGGYLALDPICLWPLYVICAYNYSVHHKGTRLCDVMSQSIFGGITDNVVNNYTHTSDAAPENKYKEISKQYLSGMKVDTALYYLDGKNVPSLSIAIPMWHFGPSIELYEVENGGSNVWLNWKDYAPALKILLQDTSVKKEDIDIDMLTLWYYYFDKEGRF